MLEIQCCCVLFLLVPVPSGTGIVTKSVCSEDSIVLFTNILDSRDTVVSLYMNHQTHTLMAQWDVQNSTIMSHIQPGYEEKVYLSKDGSVWIRDVNHWDEEKYFIKYGMDTPVKYEVEIHVKVAPKMNCKPKITHEDNILIASLEVEDCGIPVVSLQWLDYPGISNTSEPVIDLPPGNEAGTYYACVKGPALECAKMSTLSDYCSSYTIRENDSPPLSSQLSADMSVLKTSLFVMGSIVVCIFLAPKTIKIYKIWRKYFISGESTQLQLQEGRNDRQAAMCKHSEKLTDDQIKEQMQKCLGVYPVLMEKYLGNLTEDQIWEQIQKWQDVYPGHFMKKYLESLKEDQVEKWLNDHPDFMDTYLDEHENGHQATAPTLDKLSVRLTESGTGIEGSQMQLVSTQKTFNASQSSDEHENECEAVTPTIVELSVTLLEPVNEIEDNQMQMMSTQKKFITSLSSVQTDIQRQVGNASDSTPAQVSDDTNSQLSTGVKSSVKKTMYESSQWQLEKNKWQKQKVRKDKVDADKDSDDFSRQTLLEEFGQKA